MSTSDGFESTSSMCPRRQSPRNKRRVFKDKFAMSFAVEIFVFDCVAVRKRAENKLFIDYDAVRQRYTMDINKTM